MRSASASKTSLTSFDEQRSTMPMPQPDASSFDISELPATPRTPGHSVSHADLNQFSRAKSSYRSLSSAFDETLPASPRAPLKYVINPASDGAPIRASHASTTLASPAHINQDDDRLLNATPTESSSSAFVVIGALKSPVVHSDDIDEDGHDSFDASEDLMNITRESVDLNETKISMFAPVSIPVTRDVSPMLEEDGAEVDRELSEIDLFGQPLMTESQTTLREDGEGETPRQQSTGGTVPSTPLKKSVDDDSVVVDGSILHPTDTLTDDAFDGSAASLILSRSQYP